MSARWPLAVLAALLAAWPWLAPRYFVFLASLVLVNAVVGAVAGVLIAPVVFLSSKMGLVAINGFTAAVLGGFGSMPGAVVGGMLLGVLENLAPLYLPSSIKHSVPFLVMITILLVRPSGLLGRAARRSGRGAGPGCTVAGGRRRVRAARRGSRLRCSGARRCRLRARLARRLLLLALLLQEARVRGEDHEQQPAFEASRLLDDRDVLQLRLDTAQDGLADLAMGDLAAAEHDRHARLVALGEELADGLGLEGVVVLLGLGPELHFLELDDRLLLLRLVRLLLGLVLELAVVHDLADRRLRHRRDLDQVEAELLGLGESGLEGDHS